MATVEEVIEGPNYFVKLKRSKNIILVALKRQLHYTIYLFDNNSSVARKIVKGRTNNVERILEIVQANAN